MKLAMSRLDIMVCVRELKNAIGAGVENVYEMDGSILLSLRREGAPVLIICERGRRISLTSRRPRAPKVPGPFAMLLRKHLRGSVLSGIEQPDLERVVLLEFSGDEKRTLVVELFGSGNFILCDGSGTIIHPYRAEIRRGRAIRAGERYSLPRGPGLDPSALGAAELRASMKGAPDLVRALAVNLGLGGPLAEEVCARAGIARGATPSSLSDDDLRALAEALSGMLAASPSPRIVYENGKPVDVVPFEFRTHLGRETKAFSSFNEALDEYFTELAVRSSAERAAKRLEEETERLRRRLAEEQESYSRLYERSVEMKRKADLISVKHQFVDGVLEEVRGVLRRAGHEGAMEEIKRAAGSGSWWAAAVKGVRKSGEAVIELGGEQISLDVGVNAFRNASRYYEEYKRFAEKAIGARRAMERTAAELDRLMSEGLPAPQPVPRERMWFERYRWAISSGGFLMLGGRDEKTNSEIVRKRMGPRDIYLHAEIRGAPHVIIRSEGREVPEDDVREAAEFAAMHSRAWGEGVGALKVFWVRADQVSGRAPSGMYLPKGSFMVIGERNYVEVPLRAGVGVVNLGGREVPVCGPVSAVRRHSRIFVEIFPGETKRRDAARMIAERMAAAGFEVALQDVERVLPPGGCRVI
jgi:predicted ribosome quality control (RQC) complex YloA/Tae2 family protein